MLTIWSGIWGRFPWIICPQILRKENNFTGRKTGFIFFVLSSNAEKYYDSLYTIFQETPLLESNKYQNGLRNFVNIQSLQKCLKYCQGLKSGSKNFNFLAFQNRDFWDALRRFYCDLIMLALILRIHFFPTLCATFYKIKPTKFME